MVTTIRITESDKERFDNIKRTQAYKQGKDVSQEDVMKLLLDKYEDATTIWEA